MRQLEPHQRRLGALIACLVFLVTLASCNEAAPSAPIDASFGEIYELRDSVRVRLDSAWVAPELHPGRPSPTIYRFLPAVENSVYAVLRARVENAGDTDFDLGTDLSGQVRAPGRKSYELARLTETPWCDSFVESGSLSIPAGEARSVVLFATLPSQIAREGGLLAKVRAGQMTVELDLSAYRPETIALGDSVDLSDGARLTVLRCYADRRLVPTKAEGLYTGLEAAEGRSLLQLAVRIEDMPADGVASGDFPVVTDDTRYQPFSMLFESADGKTIRDGDAPIDDETNLSLHYLLDVAQEDAPHFERVLLHFGGRCYAVALHK